MAARNLALVASADRLERMIRQRGDFSHVHVQARAGHLLVKTQDKQGVQDIVARATPIGGGEYGLSFRTHSGRWEPMPVSGGLDQIVGGLLDLLGPYLDQANINSPGEAQA
jgi:hypothetical protein